AHWDPVHIADQAVSTVTGDHENGAIAGRQILDGLVQSAFHIIHLHLEGFRATRLGAVCRIAIEQFHAVVHHGPLAGLCNITLLIAQQLVTETATATLCSDPFALQVQVYVAVLQLDRIAILLDKLFRRGSLPLHHRRTSIVPTTHEQGQYRDVKKSSHSAGCALMCAGSSSRKRAIADSRLSVVCPPAALACPPPLKCSFRKRSTGKVDFERKLTFTISVRSMKKAAKRTPRMESP